VAGEPEHRLRWYAEVGLLHRQPDGRFEPDSLRRLRMIRFARSRGVGDEQLAAATAHQGDLLGLFGEHDPVDEAAGNLTDTARGLGLDDALIAELAEILDRGDSEPITEADVAMLRALARAVAIGMPREALLQLIVVFADAMDRLADAIVRTFHNYVHERFRARGLVGGKLLEATDRIAQPMLEFVEPTVLYFHRRAYQRADREDFLRHLAEATTPPAATPGEERATILFVDLASFTPLTLCMGDQVAAEVLSRFSATARSSATRHRGRILKQIGDAFMLMFARPVDAVEFGLAMHRFIDAEPHHSALHIGAHCGTVLYREGDYVGATVNLAARVASAGAAGQFLITEDLRDAVGNLADVDFVSLPPRRLKGIPDPISLVEVRCHSAERVSRETDPVCGMLLHPDDVVARASWRGMTFVFCSQKCQAAFTDDPSSFVNTDPHKGGS
jgi:class 3 adenylate cyclase/YHS domain-containing protein